MTIDQQFRDTARRHQHSVAIDDGEQRISFGRLQAGAAELGRQLLKAGLEPGEPVVVIVANRASDITAFLAVWQAGGVVVPVHQSAPLPSRQKLLARLGNRFVIDKTLAVIREVAPVARPLLAQAGTIIFTSGSTGEPKGVVLSKTRASNKLAMIGRMTNWQPRENALIALQLTFSFGQWSTWLTLLNGGCVHLRNRFEPESFHQLLDAGKISRFPAVPTMLRKLVETGHVSSFGGQIMAGGEALPAALGRQIRKAFPKAGLGDIYGLTETGTSDFFVNASQYDAQAGSLGKAGEEIQWRLSPDSGELQIYSPWRMLGYLDEPELTAASMPDGWFHTGDLAAENADHTVRLIGRAKDLIVRSGNKISPLEVEAAFLEHPAVRAVLVAGVSDADGIESIHMAVVVDPAQACNADELCEWAQDRLERYKMPNEIHFVDALPSGSTGKADRNALRAMIAGQSANL